VRFDDALWQALQLLLRGSSRKRNHVIEQEQGSIPANFSASDCTPVGLVPDSYVLQPDQRGIIIDGATV
jgi:hypothetical protein